MKKINHTLVWVVIYSIAMGFLEAAVVIYIRELYYPEGFNFPLKEMPISLIKVELWRELATLIMLLSVAIIASKNKWQRWGYFLISFAVWDIVYYIGLKLCLNWPESFLTWDVLFLIPITWVGPVITPILIALVMIVLGIALIKGNKLGFAMPLIKLEIISLLLGAFICIVSFILDYYQQVIQHADNFSFQAAMLLSKQYVPATFNWTLFFIGFIFMCFGTAHYLLHFKQKITRKR